jgi:hypothetical protein
MIWNEVFHRWHDLNLKLLYAAPDRSAFRIGAEYELAVELEAIRLIAYSPDLSLERQSEVARDFVGLVSEILELSTLSRVGLRFFFFQEFPDRASAMAELLKTQVLHVPEGRHFGSDGDPVSYECAIGWEVKALGVRVRVGYQHREFKMEVPLELSAVKPKDFAYHGLAFDVDFYTTASIVLGQLGVQDWISQNVHALRRDMDSFLWGG